MLPRSRKRTIVQNIIACCGIKTSLNWNWGQNRKNRRSTRPKNTQKYTDVGATYKIYLTLKIGWPSVIVTVIPATQQLHHSPMWNRGPALHVKSLTRVCVSVPARAAQPCMIHSPFALQRSADCNHCYKSLLWTAEPCGLLSPLLAARTACSPIRTEWWMMVVNLCWRA